MIKKRLNPNLIIKWINQQNNSFLILVKLTPFNYNDHLFYLKNHILQILICRNSIFLFASIIENFKNFAVI